MKTQTEKVYNYLRTGRELNQDQARGLFGVRNLRARVQELRESGYAIYTNRKGGGRRAAYRMGVPKHSMVAVAYAIAGNKIFQ